MSYKQVVLLILDGWGVSPSWGGNALSMNNPKNIDYLWKNYPHAVIKALSVVSDGEVVGDSRLGHTLIGAGRPVKSIYSVINDSIKDRSFSRNETILGAINWAQKNNSNLHLIGLISDGGVHSHINHLIALLNVCRERNFDRVYIDAITDGTDSGATDALSYLETIEKKIADINFGQINSIGGRYWAMDRDNKWDRVEKYYNMLIGKKPVIYQSARKAISENYVNGLNDEFVTPGLIKHKGTVTPLKSGDAAIIFNFREDRSRQLAKTIIDKKARRTFSRTKKLDDLYFATFINYQRKIPAKIIFSDMNYKNSLSEVLAKYNINQLKIAESQKYAHVTYFFNAGAEDPYVGEDRKIIPSPEIDSFDKIPEMSAKTIAATTRKAIESGKYQFIVVNFANVDMVAHTGNIIATGKAVQIVDEMVKEITATNLKHNGATIITADHGNAEQMIHLRKASGDKESLHTLNPVPFILATPSNRKNLIQSAVGHHSNALAKIIAAKHSLADVAPTILELMQIPKPAEMTGHSLLNRLE